MAKQTIHNHEVIIMTEREQNKARCANCQHFIPDTIGFGQGIGNCKKYEDYKQKGASEQQLKIAFLQLGNELFWAGSGGGRPRNCSKYEEKQ